MKLPTVQPVTINERSFSLVEMVNHVTTKERRYNVTADAARQGKRTREAVAQGADLLPEDLKLLADVLNKPSCGWGEFVVKVPIPQADGTTKLFERRAQFPTCQFLPLIDPVQAAAASVS